MHTIGLAGHVTGGSLALFAGAAALSVRKGGPLHARAGTVFLLAMLLMATNAAFLALFKPDRVSLVTAILTIYLVVTSWQTARSKAGGEATGVELVAFAVAAGCAIADLALGLYAGTLPGGLLDHYPPAVFFAFAMLAALAAGLDLNFILRRRLSARQRLARHLWRMCVALFIAAGSFFIGQQKVMPEAIRGWWGLFVPPFATLGVMAFWLLRLRFARAFILAAHRGGSLIEGLGSRKRAAGSA
jgi:uncharacterized membrane protein